MLSCRVPALKRLIQGSRPVFHRQLNGSSGYCHYPLLYWHNGSLGRPRPPVISERWALQRGVLCNCGHIHYTCMIQLIPPVHSVAKRYCRSLQCYSRCSQYSVTITAGLLTKWTGICNVIDWLIDLRPCQHDSGYMDGRSQINVHTDERTQVHSAQYSMEVTHPTFISYLLPVNGRHLWFPTSQTSDVT